MILINIILIKHTALLEYPSCEYSLLIRYMDFEPYKQVVAAGRPSITSLN